MPKSSNMTSDPFDDDDWGTSESEHAPESDEAPSSASEERPPYLKPHHFPKSVEKGTIELIKFTSETTEYSDVVFLVKHNGKMYRLGMKLFAADYKALEARFGKKKSDWKGTLRFRIMPHKGNPRGYVAVR